MTTARDVVYSALGRIGVRDKNQPTDPTIATDVLRSLNDLMFSFSAKDLDYDHTTLTLDSVFPMEEKFNEAVTALLAERISDDYAPGAMTAKLIQDAQDGWAALEREFMSRSGRQHWSGNTGRRRGNDRPSSN